MKKLFTLSALALTAFLVQAQEKIFYLNEGGWQADNGSLGYFEDGVMKSTHLFRDVNGEKLGDTPNDIVQIKDEMLAISVNWSNIIQFIDSKGKALGATEAIPNNRKLATDGEYLYVSSYGHECETIDGLKTFTKGFAAKIELENFKVIKAVEVGWEPEGIAYYKGHLFIANSGGYSYQEDHDYEQTVYVLDAETLELKRVIDTGCINLYGGMAKTGQYLCINSCGNYYDVPAATMLLDCQAVLDGKADKECFVTMPYPSTYSTATRDGKFYAVGSSFSYESGGYVFNMVTIDPAKSMAAGTMVYEKSLPGSLEADIKKMGSPYGLYVNPYTGYMYGTDSGDYSSAGKLYQWNPSGQLLGKHDTYINPGHMLALPPNGHFELEGVDDIIADKRPAADDAIYNLQGIRIDSPAPGQVYIQGGKKYIRR